MEARLQSLQGIEQWVAGACRVATIAGCANEESWNAAQFASSPEGPRAEAQQSAAHARGAEWRRRRFVERALEVGPSTSWLHWLELENDFRTIGTRLTVLHDRTEVPLSQRMPAYSHQLRWAILVDLLDDNSIGIDCDPEFVFGPRRDLARLNTRFNNIRGEFANLGVA
jgi:hypothetical protein